MKKIEITKAQKALFSLVGHNLFSAPLNIPDDVDWRELADESVAQSVTQLALKDFRDFPLDEELAQKLHIFLKRCAVSSINCFKRHEYLHKLMTENEIPYCIVKGPASSYYYPNPLLRNMGDVDFYVPDGYVERAKEVLISDGFSFKDTGHRHHYQFKKGTMDAELHFAPISIPNDEMRPIFLEYWSDLCDKASLTKDVFSSYMLPSPFHHGFILLTHFRAHMTSGGSGLRHLCDWAVFVNSFESEEFTKLFEKKLKRVGLWRLAQAIALAAVSYLGMPHKAWMGDDYEVADALMEDVARGGNFGRRDKTSSYETVFIADHFKAPEKKRTRLGRIFYSLNKHIREKWPAAERCPLLYPIGWVCFPIRFLFRLITGRRKLNVLKTYKKGNKRVALYDRLKIYIPEE